MTKDEAFEKLTEAAEKVDAGQYASLESAFINAAMALNYIMDNIKEEDEPEESS